MPSTLTFPNDDNGDALRRLQAGGDDLSKPRDIDFTVVLPTAEGAEALARHFRALGYEVNSERADCVAGLPWDVLVKKPMLPTHAGITAFEAELEREAGPLGGRIDGWGCFGL